MVQLIKRDFLLIGPSIIFVWLIQFFIYLSSSRSLSLDWMPLIVIFSLFNTDDHEKINRYLVGIPVNRTAFVRSRYLSCLACMLCLNLIPAPPESGLFLNKPNPIAFLSGMITVIALLLPLFYLKISPIIASLSFLICIFPVSILFLLIASVLGFYNFFHLLTSHMAFSTILLAVSLVLFYLSMKQSERLFAKKDLI